MKLWIMQAFFVWIQGFITYNQGNFEFSDLKGFSCENLSSTIANITFEGTFENPPQIMVALTALSMSRKDNKFVEIDIVSTATDCMNYYYDDFQIQISCQDVYGYKFQWYAVNDHRITILNPTRQTNLMDGTIFMHTHSLIKATKGLVAINSFYHQGRPLDFYLEIYQVTSTFVQIKLNNFSSKLSELGYSVVIGTEEAFQLGNLIFTSNTPYSGSKPQLNQGMLFLPLNGFHWDQNDLIRINIYQQLSLSNFQYEVKSFSTSYMNSFRFQEVQFFKKILFPMYIYSYRKTNKYERYIQSAVKIHLLELNKYFISIGEYNVQIPEQMIKITIEIELKFMPNEKLIGKFLKCNECGLKNVYKIEQNYLCGYNFIRYRLLLRKHTLETQDLILSIGLSTVNIKQIINQVALEHEIVQLQFVGINI